MALGKRYAGLVLFLRQTINLASFKPYMNMVGPEIASSYIAVNQIRASTATLLAELAVTTYGHHPILSYRIAGG
jgi:hypothetical protein